MTGREAILKAVHELPDDFLAQLAHYVESLKQQGVRQGGPTALASERSLAKDWLRPEEDEAWQDL